ncbi:MAG TPA: acetate kinase, partial [Candidatus Sumerlaeia bacterium]|nr:acetate kinase [Candidatus Sumerlaeia bacterium]
RCGDIDPAILMYLQENDGVNVAGLNKVLNKQSGLIGISGISNDMRELEKAAAENNARAKLAIDIFCYRIRKYIGAYAVAMGGVDFIVFTAGIGENSHIIRGEASKGLEAIGAKVDEAKNKSLNGKEGVFSTEDSKVKLCVIPTNEEILIAHDTVEAVSGLL